MNLTEKLKNESGVSLIELMVAMAIFTVLILSATQIFKMVLDGQRNAVSAQNVQENIRYGLEKISKEIRMAQISNQDCLGSADYKVFNKVTDSDGNEQLYFKNKDGDCVVYYLENNRLKASVGAYSDFITPAKLKVNNLKFLAVDDLIGAFHSVQPYVTMTMDVKSGGQGLPEQAIKIQTTISSRYYE